MDGRFRKDCKKPITISEYLNKKTNTWLDDYIINVSDFEYAEKIIEKERKDAAESPSHWG